MIEVITETVTKKTDLVRNPVVTEPEVLDSERSVSRVMDAGGTSPLVVRVAHAAEVPFAPKEPVPGAALQSGADSGAGSRAESSVSPVAIPAGRIVVDVSPLTIDEDDVEIEDMYSVLPKKDYIPAGEDVVQLLLIKVCFSSPCIASYSVAHSVIQQ